jgi:enterochelin esterase-like enzyme
MNAAALVEDKFVRREDQPGQLARKNADTLRKQTRIRIGCGSLDDLLPKNHELHELLQQLGIEHQYEVVPDVAHNASLYYQKLGTKVFEFHRKSLEALGKVK